MLNLKKSLILILISTIIASCSTANPFVNTGRGVTEVEGIDFPEIGKVTIGSLGDTLVSKGTKSYTPAITVLDEWVWKEGTNLIPRHWVAANTEFVLTGIWIHNETGEEYKCFTGKYNYDAHWNYYNVPGVNLPMDLCKDKFGKWHDFQSLFFDGAGVSANNLEFDARYKEFTKVELNGVSFVQEFLYNGRVNNSLKFVYREFSGDLARPAFTQEIQYDFDQSNIIGFKGLQLEVIEATNTRIVFKVLNNF